MEGNESGLLATSDSAATLSLESQRYRAFDLTGDWGREINPQDTHRHCATSSAILAVPRLQTAAPILVSPNDSVCRPSFLTETSIHVDSDITLIPDLRVKVTAERPGVSRKATRLHRVDRLR